MRPRRAPLSISDARIEEAFVHGALGPDVGFVPGTERLVSEFAHYLQPGDLLRDLIDRASTRTEAAFAWGWATHVLGDAFIHPIVGRAVGERLHGDPSVRVDAIEDTETHVSLEVGLDIALLRKSAPRLRAPRTPLFRSEADAEHLASSLESVYGIAWDIRGLVRDHRRAGWQVRWWPRAISRLPLHPAGGVGPAVGGRFPGQPAALVARGITPSGSAQRGFFRPEAPRPWFLAEVREQIRAFPGAFQSWLARGLSEPSNPNLETGEPAGPGRGHPASDLAARKLALLKETRPHGPL